MKLECPLESLSDSKLDFEADNQVGLEVRDEVDGQNDVGIDKIVEVES